MTEWKTISTADVSAEQFKVRISYGAQFTELAMRSRYGALNEVLRKIFPVFDESCYMNIETGIRSRQRAQLTFYTSNLYALIDNVPTFGLKFSRLNTPASEEVASYIAREVVETGAEKNTTDWEHEYAWFHFDISPALKIIASELASERMVAGNGSPQFQKRSLDVYCSMEEVEGDVVLSFPISGVTHEEYKTNYRKVKPKNLKAKPVT